ncbi:hypothetical protein BDB01DRAFT_792270 [Pilobolus umbonatus]|nr:hypothetical protein BDB01DRAFT_792270 [Pilobolus umbonatus]
MDVYSLTRKKRPSHLTLAQPSRTPSDNDSALDVSLLRNSVSKYPSRSPSSYIFDEVVGEPSREHWKNDADSAQCELSGCSVTFGLFERRHHCRKCGDIYCSIHCSNYFRLDQFAQFHPRGILSRGCDTCAADYIRWQEELRQMGRENNPPRRPHGDKLTQKKRHAGIMTQQPQAMEGVTELGRDDIVLPSRLHTKGLNISKAKKDPAFNPISSVPADWQWSTF